MKSIVILFCLLFLAACGNSSTSVGNGAYTISGTVKAADGTALSGATVTFTGAASGTVTTGSDGKYSFTGVNNGVYQVTATKTGYITPSSLSITVANADVTGKDFTAAAARYIVTGIISSGGSSLSGVTVTLSGDSNTSATTDASGSYSFSVLNGSYTVSPVLSGYTFAPATLSATVSNANVSGKNFTAALVTYAISGNAALSGSPLGSVTVTLSGTATASTTTDSSGNYTFSGITSGSYSVTPTKSGYLFLPASAPVTVSNVNNTGNNFNASLLPSDCVINSINYPNGTANSGNLCQVCNTAVSVSDWSPVVCSASDQCHDVGTCNPVSGICTNPPKANGSTCDDGNACTQTDTCQAGTCTGANPVTCTALDQCHSAGTCNPGSGLCSTPLSADGTHCDDGNTSTQTDTCQAGVCTGF